MWQRFLTDSEDAIRASAPREPSARDRTPGWRPGPAGTQEAVRSVGELWWPDEPLPQPAWRDLDGRARLRRVARVLATAAAVALALTVWSQLGTGSDAPSGGPGDPVVERVEEAPASLPTAGPPTAVSPAGPAASASVSASATATS